MQSEAWGLVEETNFRTAYITETNLGEFRKEPKVSGSRLEWSRLEVCQVPTVRGPIFRRRIMEPS